MKTKHFYLISEQVKSNAIAAINDAVLDGKTKVTLSSAGTKSARQRGLQWIWYGDVAKSGIGGYMHETAQGVSILAKVDYGMPIIHSNPEKYADFLEIYHLVCERHGGDEAFMFRFYDKHLHTEWFDTNEMAQFLTAFQVYYTNHGVNLSDPIDYKLLRAA